MKNLNNQILDAMQFMLDKFQKDAPFYYIKDGTITTILENGKYIVHMEGTDYSVPSLNNNTTYTVGQTVKIMIPNNDFSKKFILGTIKY